jgi:membrane protein DedA with SNARE-associated domain
MIRDPYERNEQTPDPLLLARVTAPLWATVLVGAGWVTGRWLALPTRTIGPWVGALCGGAIAAVALFALAVESRMEHRAAERPSAEWSSGPDER